MRMLAVNNGNLPFADLFRTNMLTSSCFYNFCQYLGIFYSNSPVAISLFHLAFYRLNCSSLVLAKFGFYFGCYLGFNFFAGKVSSDTELVIKSREYIPVYGITRNFAVKNSYEYFLIPVIIKVILPTTVTEALPQVIYLFIYS